MVFSFWEGTEIVVPQGIRYRTAHGNLFRSVYDPVLVGIVPQLHGDPWNPCFLDTGLDPVVVDVIKYGGADGHGWYQAKIHRHIAVGVARIVLATALAGFGGGFRTCCEEDGGGQD